MPLTKDVINEDALLQNIVEYERVTNERRRRAAAAKSTWTTASSGSTGTPRNFGAIAASTSYAGIPGSSKQQVYSASDDRECYNCHEKGHVAKACSKPPTSDAKCYVCGERGHFARSCTNPKPLSTGEMKNVYGESSVGNISKYVKYVYIGGCSLKALTGSSDCTIKASVVLNAGFEVTRQASELRGFGKSDNVVQSCGVIVEKVLVDDAAANAVKLRIVPDDVQYYDVIIGRNFTELPHVVYFKL